MAGKPLNSVTSATGRPAAADGLASALPFRQPQNQSLIVRGGKVVAPGAAPASSAPAGGGSGTPSGAGTVTSVGLSMPSTFLVTFSPVTGTGVITVTYAPVAANLVLAGPLSGAAGQPAFRALTAADLPPGSTGFAPASVQAPASVTFDHADYSGSTEYITWRAQNTINPVAGAIDKYGWQTSPDNATWTSEAFVDGDTYQGVGIVSGNQYARVRAYPLVASGVTPTPSGWVSSSAQAYAAPATNTSVFVSPVSGYQALLQVAPGYQVAPGNAGYVSAPLLTDKTSGDSTSGYKGVVTGAPKPSTIAFQSGNSIASGIIMALPVSEGTGTTVRDISGNGLDTAFYGSPTWGTGPNGTILTCSGPSVGLSIADTALLKPTAGLTISAYVNTSASQSYGRIMRKGSSAGGYFAIVGNSAGSSMNTTGTSYAPNYSSQLGATYEGAYHLYTYTISTTTNQMAFYIDGNLIGTSSGSGTLSWDTATQQIMGGAYNDGSAGSLDVYYEWNRALTASEVGSLAANPYQLIGVSAGGSVITVLLTPGLLGLLPFSTVKITRTWTRQLSEVLEYSNDGSTWTPISTGYTPGNNAGTATSLQTTVAIGSTITPLYLRYSGKDSGSGSAILLTDFSVS